MKRIYMVSLDDEVPLSKKVEDKIKILCYYVYDEIRGLEYDTYDKILYTDIRYNELLEKKDNQNNYSYRFEYENFTDGKFEPFMISNTSFGFTVNDDLLSKDELSLIIERCKNIARIYYNFKIESITYEDDPKNKNRLVALKKVLLSNEENNKKKAEQKEDKYIKTRFNPMIIPSVLKLR